MIGSAALILLRARSQINNYAQAVHGTYLTATGGQHQHFSVLSSLSVSVAYGGVIDQRGEMTNTSESVSKYLCQT